MNINEYISSGAIENYVLGLASPEEIQEMEKLCLQFPEIQRAKTDFEISLEKTMQQNAVPPPAQIKNNFLTAIETENTKPISELKTASVNTKPAKVIPLNTNAPKSIKWLRGAVAAAAILLIGSSILNFYFYSQFKHYSAQYKDLLAQSTTQTAKLKAMEASFNMVKDPDMKPVIMHTTDAAGMPNAMATVYWDMNNKKAWLMVNNLPKIPSNKQYQLWAIVAGKPVDAGMIDLQKTDELVMPMDKPFPDAQAFAISLEDMGGSRDAPKGKVYVLGKT